MEETGSGLGVVVLPIPKELDNGMVVKLFEVSNLGRFTDEVSDQLDECVILQGVTWGVLVDVVHSFFHRLIMEENCEEYTLILRVELFWDHE